MEKKVKKKEALEIPEIKGISIKDWSKEDQPREKLLHKGKSALSNAELIAILLRSGTQSINALDMGKFILNKASNNLNELAKFSVQDFIKIKGIGLAKAISIVSALELGRRRKEEKFEKKVVIKSSENVHEVMKPELLDLKHEEFWVLHLSRSNQVLRKEVISRGGVSGTLVDAKLIFKRALEELASAIILVHNHPSGNIKPSSDDISLTQQLISAGKLLDIPVLDHVIFTDNGYYSFLDKGLM